MMEVNGLRDQIGHRERDRMSLTEIGDAALSEIADGTIILTVLNHRDPPGFEFISWNQETL